MYRGNFAKVVYSQETSAISLHLYDYTGRLLQQKQLKVQNEALDLSYYAPGMYYIRLLKQGKDIGGGKVIKR